ncbi:hypothetical protein [Methylobacterium sp. GC_Met_2]|uniref:hypothetical protein n=1 Tax=Methylobacterium sp. GC_Met_2 TaxID=2937376 RepID=UPI00226B08FD
MDELIVGNLEGHDLPSHLGCDADDVAVGIGVVGRRLSACRQPEIQAATDHQQKDEAGDSEYDRPAVAAAFDVPIFAGTRIPAGILVLVLTLTVAVPAVRSPGRAGLIVRLPTFVLATRLTPAFGPVVGRVPGSTGAAPIGGRVVYGLIAAPLSERGGARRAPALIVGVGSEFDVVAALVRAGVGATAAFRIIVGHHVNSHTLPGARSMGTLDRAVRLP